MKKFLSFLFIVCACNVYANNYGNQDSVSLTVRGSYGGTQTLLGLVHVPSDYNTDVTTKHPFIIFICGTGAYGTSQVLVQNEGMSNALYTGTWDGTAVNPKTGATEKFITLSLQHPDGVTGIDGRQVDDAVGWLFSHYHGIDTTRGTVTGLSRGGGSTCGYLEHILTANPCTSWTFFHPAHNIPFFIPMSAENNACDPVDSVFIYNNHVWGFGGDSTGCSDVHGATTHTLCDNINKRKANLAQFTSYYNAANGCHAGWERFYAASYKSSYKSDVYSYASISIYQAALLYGSSGNNTAPVNTTVTANTVSGSPFCVTSSNGSTATVPYTTTGSFTNGNVFQAQLSDAGGSFTNAINIGSTTTTNASGTINCTIPAGTATGSGYRIRVNATNPQTTGSDNGTNLTINLAANSIAPTASQNIHVGVNGTTLTVTEKSAVTSRTWYYGTASGGPYNTSTGVTAATYTPNFSVANTYYVVCVSTTSCGAVTSNYVMINVTNPTPPPATISTNAVSGSPFCVTSTNGSTVSVAYTATGSFTNGNVFQAQLSDAGGNFSNAINIGSITTTNASGTISCTIPNSTATGTGYRIRVNATNPQTTGSNNGANLTITLTGNSISPAANQSIRVKTNGATLTVTEASAPASRTWYYGTVSGGPYNTSTGVTAATYTPYFSIKGKYYVICKSVWSCAAAQSNEVKITVTRTRFGGLQTAEQTDFALQSQMAKQPDFFVQSQNNQVICHYTVQHDAAVQLIIYDTYARPRASFGVKQNAGTYMHTFNQRLPNGLYIVVLQSNQQRLASKEILIGK